MSPMRKVARTMARSMSYREDHTTGYFDSLFNEIWRVKYKHPEVLGGRHTKKKRKNKRRKLPWYARIAVKART